MPRAAPSPEEPLGLHEGQGRASYSTNLVPGVHIMETPYQQQDGQYRLPHKVAEESITYRIAFQDESPSPGESQRLVGFGKNHQPLD